MDFTIDHHQAVTLAGTVPLPSPYPAYGQAFFAYTEWDGEPVVYVKLVQVVSPKNIVTRFIKPEDVRAIRTRTASEYTDPETWPLLSPTKTRKAIDDGIKAIIAKAKAAKATHLEISWQTAAILYVAEAAPVLHRHDVAMTAALSFEQPALTSTHCCG